ncbi:MAG: PIN domain-containing protein [Verrucomicrobia bacterium]|nr:PIN domain-containing protein [Verrucomicrobiota bacterium]
MKCPRALRKGEGVVLDTNVLIYLFEDHREYGPVAEFVLNQAASGVFSAVITPITTAEILVKPLAMGRTDIADAYRRAMRNLANIKLIDLDGDAGVMAVSLRAKYGIALPDAFQASVALQSRTPIIITNDKEMSKVAEVRTVTLSEFES